MSAALVARAARAALRKAFPGSKISVTSSGGIAVRWTDDGPSVEQVQETLLAAGCAEARTGWDGKRYLNTPEKYGNGHYWFDRYNVAQRAAEQEERERRCQEQMAERQCVAEVIARESTARRSAWPTLWEQKLPPVQDPAIFAAFETLRQRAEVEVQIGEDAKRRPSWAPPLLLSEELGELCLELGYIADDDMIARLWADFATPTRSGKWLREHASTLPLAGLHCRGFTLYAGAARGSRESLLFEAQREESGAWRFGPQEYALGYQSSRRREWEQLIQERERNRYELGHYGERLSPERQRQLDDGITEGWRKLAAIDVEDLIKATTHHDRQRMRQRALQLARTRVLEFVGAPDAEMQTAARLWGHCCVCGKELTDPVSLERGIGPDCFGRRVDYIRRAASEGRALESIAAVAGMPLEFISAVLHERAAS